MNMKNIIFLFALIVCTLAIDQSIIDEELANIMEIGLECAETEHATAEDIEALKNYAPAVTHEGKCVIFCIHKKLNMMNEDGVIAEKITNKWMEKIRANDAELYENLLKLYKNCHDKVPSKGDACDTAGDFFICLVEESKKMGIHKLFS